MVVVGVVSTYQYTKEMQYCWKPTIDFSVKMKRMRTVADSDSATSESDVENSYNTDNEVETYSVSESDSDNVDDTSSEEGDEYDPWAPLKAEATQQSLS